MGMRIPSVRGAALLRNRQAEPKIGIRSLAAILEAGQKLRGAFGWFLDSTPFLASRRVPPTVLGGSAPRGILGCAGLLCAVCISREIHFIQEPPQRSPEFILGKAVSDCQKGYVA